MQMSPIIEGIAEDLRRAGALGGDETRRLADLLVSSAESSIGLRIIDALHAAASELEASAPGATVEIRLEGRDPVLSLRLPETAAEPERVSPEDAAREAAERLAGYLDDELARLTLRLPEGLKAQIEDVAVRAGASINSYIVTALARSLDTTGGAPPGGPPPGRRMSRRITGYVRG